MIFIIVYKLNKNLIKISKKEYALFFPDSESLTKTVLFLMKNIKNTKSSLYSFMGRFVLITESFSKNNIMIINEFCLSKTNNKIKIETIKEYGKPLIINNAIKRYGVAFLKD